VDWDEESKMQEDPAQDGEWTPLSQFVEEQIVTTQCSNAGAVIEWLFVPFIEEEEPSTNTTAETLDNETGTSTTILSSSADEF
jgi:hypothetical protein